MKIIITGSLGHISQPLTETLLEKGHAVTVISHNPERRTAIEALGAQAAIGTMEDAGFLAHTFTGADAVYGMFSTEKGFADHNLDLLAYTNSLANNYKHALQQSGVKRLVTLSSIGAHTDQGNGLLALYFHAENILNQLAADIAITFMRPVGFYYNLLGFIPTIKTQGVIAANYGGTAQKPWVSPRDIAAAVAEEITSSATGRKVRYVASEEIACNEIACILGAAIGKPELQWIVIPDEQMLKGLLASGMNPRIAAGLVEMNASIHNGKVYEDYDRNRPTLGKVKLKDFAREFAVAYNQS